MGERVTFCEACRKDVCYLESAVTLRNDLKGETYEYIGKQAVCNECGEDVYVAEVADYNLKALYDAFRGRNGIISHERIMELPKKYGIGKRPLSLLLGWGEMTFSRYYDGDMPTKQYSDVLQRIYNDPNAYLTLLERSKANLTQTAYEKSKRTTEELLGIPNTPLAKIDIVVNYLLCKCEDFTPLALQKALYYIQGFYYAFKDVFLFPVDCEAWVHGPVYREIYSRYRTYRFDPIKIDDKCDESALTTFEKAVIDSVIKNFCCYSGKILERFTHSEEPWLVTRGDLSNTASSNKIIPRELIGHYFKAVKERHEMINPSDIEFYSKTLFTQIN